MTDSTAEGRRFRPTPMRIWARLLLAGITLLSLISDITSGALDGAYFGSGHAVLLAGAYLPLVLLLYRVDVAAFAMAVAMAVNLAGSEPMRLAIPILIVAAYLAALGRRMFAFAFYGYIVLWALLLVFGQTPESQGILWAFLPMATVAMGGAMLVSELRQGRRKDAARMRSLELEKAEVRANERHRLAGELHDIVAYDVTVIAMQARMGLALDDPDRSREILGTIDGTARHALEDLRRLVAVLRLDVPETHGSVEPARSPRAQAPSAVTDSGGLAATSASSALAEDLAQVETDLGRLGYQVTVTLTGDLDEIPTSLRHSIRRTLREAVVNVVKHAGPGAGVGIELAVGPGGVDFSAINDVTAGPSTIPSGGRGLAALEERASAFGGTCHHGRRSDGRFAVDLHLPFSDHGKVHPL